MSHGVATAMVACQLHAARPAKRLAQVWTRLSEKPVHRIPRACHGWAETVAAYRFLDHPAMGEQGMRSGHQHATLARIRAQEGVLLMPDTTFLDDGTTQPKSGMGTVQIKVREEDLRHPTVAFTPERMHLGVLGLQGWQRPVPPMAHERHRKPMAETESYRWLPGSPLACAVQQRCPTTRVVHVAAREGDMQEGFLEAARRAPGERAECIIRATGERRSAQGKDARYWWATRQQARGLGSITVERTRQPHRPPRQATLSVAVKRVMGTGARRPGGRLPPVEVVAVYAKEPRPPGGEEPLAWRWRTSLPVADFSSACTVVQGYRCRWEIDVLFRVLKPGGQIEQWRVHTAPRWLNAVARYVIIAWRIHQITMAGRASPEVSCAVVFEPRAWHTMYTMPHHHPPPQLPPPLRAMVRSWAHLGGFFARTGDGEPGIQAIWQGDQRLHAFIYALETHRTGNAI